MNRKQIGYATMAMILVNAVIWTLIAVEKSHGAEPLDLAILTDTKPIAARASEALDLRILAEPVAMAARPVEALDLSILIDAPTAKPLDWVYPLRGSHWTHPGTIRQHVLEGVHAGKLTAEQVAAMTDAELEAWHSDDHEGKAKKPAQVERVAEAKPRPKRGTLTSDGVIYYEHSDGVYRARKEDGCDYTPSKAAAPAYQQPAYQSGGCPGGVCPVNRATPFRIFRRG